MRNAIKSVRGALATAFEALFGVGEDLSGRMLIVLASGPLAIGVIAANLIGASILYALVSWVIPVPDIANAASARTVNAIALGTFVAAAVTLGVVLTIKDIWPVIRWLREDRPPSAEEQMLALLGPRRLFFRLVVIWGVGVVLFIALNLTYNARLALVVAIAGIFSGLAACAFSYLFSERVMRQIARRALEDGPDEHPTAPGVTFRVILVWMLTTGAPVLGVAMVGGGVAFGVLARDRQDQLAYSALIICSVALIVGFLAMVIVAKSIADPVRSVRRGVDRVREGDLNVAVPLYDASDLGMLQSGFNQMVAGLRERERMRDIFGRHVGEDVAEHSLAHGSRLGGEVREVAALFVDIVGSTALAAERSPEHVVDLLNRFFGIVVDVVTRHGGSVNKFEGDAALCVFGAPADRDDAAGDALAAARELATRLRADVPELAAGIGVSGGPAVAGNIGAAERFEYTVIGDPINEAARLTEVAKGLDGMVAASGELVQRARAHEATQWSVGESIQLRGRSAQTQIATPEQAART